MQASRVPLLSIVVPVYNVQPYLRECLDSFLGQRFTDFELIAVDDRSPDRCGEIIDEYAARDQRVRALHLERNAGLGGARNAGLAQATGEYVWFVDSDDSIADGCLAAVAARLAETGPDVLVVDYARTYWNGAVHRNALAEVLAPASAPDVFDIGEYPRLLTVFPCAWNKVVRRRFLLDADLPFPPGWYEDLPFTYPLLALAKRISTLDLVCVYYRQRRHGAILGTGGIRHFEVLGQYERVLERLDRIGPAGARVRAYVLVQAIEHGLVVLRNPERTPKRRRAEFFHRLHRFYRRHAAEGYQMPDGNAGLRHRLVARDAWVAYSALRMARMTGGRVRGVARRGTRNLRKMARLGTKAAVRAANLGYYWWQRRRPLDPELAVYSIYWGRGYGCNPAAVYEKALELAPRVRGVWVVTADKVTDLPAGLEHVVQGSRAYYRAMARAKFTFNNVNFNDDVVKRAGSTHVQTHHGTALKIMGLDQQRFPDGAGSTNFEKLLRRSDRWDYSIVSNTYSTEVWGRAYPCDYESLEYGYPRNDLLSNASADDVRKLRANLGLDPTQRVVLYAPTHREFHAGYQQLLDLDALAEALGPDARILVRTHHFYDQRGAGTPLPGPQIIDVSRYPRVEELYLVADMLITDYSSVMFDYGVLNRPIVIFAPDWEAYRLTRGAYFDLMQEPPGAVATTEEELREVFRSGAAWGEDATAARARFRQRFCQFDDGRAAERVVRKVILGETVDF